METVLLVNGLWRNRDSMKPIGKALSKEGYSTLFFDYSTMGRGLEENINELRDFIKKLGIQKLNIVAHSMGGALVLHMLKDHDDILDGKVVCLGSPIKGSISAKTLRMSPFGEAMLGKTMVNLLDHDPLLSWKGPQKIGMICGDFPFGLGRIICRLPRPHDGTITMNESLIDGITDSILIPVSHVGMLYSKKVIKQISSFLNNSYFMHE